MIKLETILTKLKIQKVRVTRGMTKTSKENEEKNEGKENFPEECNIEKVKFEGCSFSTNLYDVVQEKRK
jgi:peroxiredoxin family protein